jgi:glycosyltransferase involved in cell wall biosynthesis
LRFAKDFSAAGKAASPYPARSDRFIRVRIGIYVDVAKDPEPRGVGFHVLHLLRALSELDSTNEYLLYYQRTLKGGSEFPHRPNAPNFRNRALLCPQGWDGMYPRIWWKHYLPWIAARDRVDVFHGPSHFVPISDHIKTVVTIHDLAFFRMQLYTEELTRAMRVWTQLALDHATRVIALSRNTQKDIENLGVAESRIRLIYGSGNVIPDDRIRYDRLSDVRSRFGLPERYILFVGTIHPRKNVPFLLRSFAQLRQPAGIPHKLVLAGRLDSAATEVRSLITELGLEDDVIITGYVDEWEIPLLYKMADVFVLPTLYEGFTLVTLEAMSYGVPVISTDTSSIREGVGDAAVLVPVNDVDALTKALRSVLTDPALAERLVREGTTQAARFSWSRCARETLQLYHEVHQTA